MKEKNLTFSQLAKLLDSKFKIVVIITKNFDVTI